MKNFKFPLDEVPSKRVNSYFTGKFNGKDIKFKFTYLRDVEKQVKIISGENSFFTNLVFFNRNVITNKKNDIFVESI
ncbi:MAG TPA: hypothetical protein PLM63_04070 [bacterium]|nr:hypothetical protein [bacterium]